VTYSSYFALALATLPTDSHDATSATTDLDDVLHDALLPLRQQLDAFRQGSIDPAATARFEADLQRQLRQLGRLATQWVYNHLEPQDVRQAPQEVWFENLPYRRLAQKTPQTISTLFGNVTVRRLRYRACAALNEPLLFPLCRQLGLVHSVSPALLERLAWLQAQAGATQRSTLLRLREEHAVTMGVKRLRQVTSWLSQALEEHRQKGQADQLLLWLQQANASRGRHRVGLCVGRDGITLGLRGYRACLFQVASTATVSVYDRRGRRKGTVYLAWPPESGQTTLSEQLTGLLVEVLARYQGSALRLSYVTDAGDHETTYHEEVLQTLRHPRTHERLEWVRVVDYYHATLRLSTMAEALFGATLAARSWAAKMRKELLRPSGVNRVLHSAAALRSRRGLRGNRQKEFGQAYRYLRDRRAFLRYAEYRSQGIPIGSGVTEAACKTVFTQRLKLSGMRWQRPGALTILRLRVIWLSGVWEVVTKRLWREAQTVEVRTPEPQTVFEEEIAA
jgi:hypothetical protein